MEQGTDQAKPTATWEKDFQWGAAADAYTRYTIESRNGWLWISAGGAGLSIPPEVAVWFAETVAEAAAWDGVAEAGSSEIED